MKNALTLLFFVKFSIVGTNCVAESVDEQALTNEAQGIVKAFTGRLKPRLKRSLEEGGPAMAVEVCAGEAPQIADSLAQETGWSVSRVSLKTRNAKRAEADEWERAMLQTFDQRAEAGEPVAALNASAIGNGQFRYMQAQGVEGVCLVCHGEHIGQEARAALDRYYPDDNATGYRVGQVRGAISISFPTK